MTNRSYSKDLSQGVEDVPVWIEDGVPPDALSNFQYDSENVQGPGCDLDPRAVTIPGCCCHPRTCVPGTCQCLRYGWAFDSGGRLIPPPEQEAWLGSTPVFECNALCACRESCRNRVVQKGVSAGLAVFRTGPRGLGVEALEPLARGSFVCEYAGEVIGPLEARRRQLAQSPAHMNYIIAVREHSGEQGVTQTFVDPERVGNVGRFLNHSCQPNLVMVPVRVHSLLPRLALFAARDIEQHEELTFHYAGDTNPPGGHEEAEAEPGGVGAWLRKACLCGASNCSGLLPLDLSVLH